MAEAEVKQVTKGLAVGKVTKVDFKNYLPVTTYNNNLAEPIKYGKSNRYFNELVDIIHQSAVARRCASKIAAFIVGNTQTQGIITHKLLQELALQIAVFETVCFRVVYAVNPTFAISKIEAVPVELVRKNGEGDFVYNPRLQMKYDKKYDERLYGWLNHNEKEREDLTIDMIANDKNIGFLYYAYMPAVGAYEYSTPTWASSQDIVSADGLLSALMKGQLDNGFMPQTIITAVGDVLEKTLNQDGTISSGNTNDLAQTIKDALGATVGGGVAFINSPNPDAKINIQFVDSTKFTENAASISKLLNEGVCRIFGVPPTLAGISEAGKLGSNQQLATEVKAFNNDLQPYKQLLTNSLADVYGSTIELIPLEPIAFIDPVLAEVLTEEEKRKIFGFEPRDYAKVTV